MNALVKTSNIQLEDRVYRSFGVLSNSRIIETKEAAKCLSDVRLGIDIGYIKDIPRNILNELMILTQPGFLQQYAGGPLRPNERDIRRASLIRERLKYGNNKSREEVDMMFGRFTERAQKVLALAQEEAIRLGHNNIGTEHILLGLVREGEGIAAKALYALGLSSEKIQKEVEDLIGRGQDAHWIHSLYTTS